MEVTWGRDPDETYLLHARVPTATGGSTAGGPIVRLRIWSVERYVGWWKISRKSDNQSLAVQGGCTWQAGGPEIDEAASGTTSVENQTIGSEGGEAHCSRHPRRKTGMSTESYRMGTAVCDFSLGRTRWHGC